MANDQHEPRQQQPPSHQAHLVTMVPRRRVRRLVRWRKVQTVRLGGKKPKRRLFGVMMMRRMFRRMRLRWLKVQYLRLVKRLKEHYRNLVKDVIEGGAAIETFQQRLFLETSLATVSFGVTLSSYPSHFGSDRPRTIFM